jgi:molybdopterin-guanine dinucleotide biosynthesis protein A
MRDAAAAIVLAGGAGRRLAAAAPPGGKPWVEFGGRTSLERVTSAVAAETARVIVVAAPKQPLPPLAPAVEIVRDTAPGSGPLAGLRDGLALLLAGPAAPPRAVVVASCDVPLVRRGLVRLLLEFLLADGGDWAVPVVDGHPQVLLSAMRPSLEARIEARLAAGLRDVRGLLADPAVAWRPVPESLVRTVDPGLESFLDVDTPADVDAIRAGKIPPSSA